MDNGTLAPQALLRPAAWLLLAGQFLYVIVTLFHAGGVANDHTAIFATYAESAIWTAVHVVQFLCMAILLGGLFALFLALGREAGVVRWLGAALVVTALALYGAVLAVDGVALKQAVNAWVSAPEAEKAARFASAETVRWLEWGMRSYENFVLGLAMLLLALAVARTAWAPRPVAFLMGLSGLAYLAQGWTAGSDGFSHAHEIGIITSEVFNLVWMAWLVVATSRTQHPQVAAAI